MKVYNKTSKVIYEVQRTAQEYGLDIVIYKEYSYPESKKPRRYCLDAYTFWQEYEILKDI